MTQGQSAPMALTYAPPSRNNLRPAVVIVSGLATTVLALFGVWWANHHSEENIMGWYANYVIPAGALLVGIVAACGYGIASYVGGVKIRRGLLLLVVALQFFAYTAAQYIEYRVEDPWRIVASGGVTVTLGSGRTVQVAPVGFFRYFHENAISFAWKDKTTNKPGEPMGYWGYAFRLLEILGFVGGGLIVPVALMGKAYCDLCQMYMKTSELTVLPASVKHRKVSKKKAEELAAYEQEQAAADDDGAFKLELLKNAATAGDVNEFKRLLTDAAPTRKSAGKLPRRIQVSLVRCKGCASGHLKATLLTGQGKQLNKRELGDQELSQAFVRGI